MNRRQFFTRAGVAGAALTGFGGMAAGQEAEKPSAGIKKHNVLGRTEWKVSDVSFGAGGLKDTTIVERAVELGMNYFDTAPDYFPASEETLGKVLPKVRDKIFLATKLCTYGKYPQHLELHTPAEKFIECVEGSLTRLQTDRVDVLLVHAAGEKPPTEKGEKDIERLKDPEMLKAFDTLKKQGKARFLGMSTHGPHMMEETIDYAVECGQYDLVMPTWNFMKFTDLQKVLDKAKAKNVAIVAMKTVPGAKQTLPDKMAGLSQDEATVAALKWALSNPAISTVVKGAKSVADVDLHATASGQKMTRRDEDALRRFASAITRSYCRTGCGECVNACPKGVAIASVLRYNMYFEHYGHERFAMDAYGQLARPCSAAACAGCDAPCTRACPHGLPLKDMLCQAHSNLHFA